MFYSVNLTGLLVQHEALDVQHPDLLCHGDRYIRGSRLHNQDFGASLVPFQNSSVVQVLHSIFGL